jgi:hypothetical protein
VGNDPWAFPVPLVRGSDNQWRFDPKAGYEAIRERRIGANERAAMQAVLAYVDAQREYATAITTAMACSSTRAASSATRAARRPDLGPGARRRQPSG